jgi:hypothetical protein
MVAAAVVVFVDSGRQQRRRRWDGWTMTQWHWRQWRLWTMVAVVMGVVVINCAAAVDAAATIPSLALTAAAKTPSLPPPLTIASINDDCYCRQQRPPLLLPHSQR